MEARVSKRPHDDDDGSLAFNSQNPNRHFNNSSDISNQRLGAAAAGEITDHDDNKRLCRRSSYDVPSTIIERPIQQLRQQESSLSFQSTTTEQSDTIRQGDDSSSNNDDADDEMECTSSDEGGQEDDHVSIELSQQATGQATREDSVETRMMVDDLSSQMGSWSLTNLKAWRRRWSSLSDSNINSAVAAATTTATATATATSQDQNSQASSHRTSNKNMNDASSSLGSVFASSNNSYATSDGRGLRGNNFIRLQQKEAKRQVMKVLRGRSSNESMGGMHDHEACKIANH